MSSRDLWVSMVTGCAMISCAFVGVVYTALEVRSTPEFITAIVGVSLLLIIGLSLLYYVREYIDRFKISNAFVFSLLAILIYLAGSYVVGSRHDAFFIPKEIALPLMIYSVPMLPLFIGIRFIVWGRR